MRWTFPYLLSALPALSAVCPPPEDRAADIASIIAEAAAAKDEASAQVIANRLWEIWATAPDATAQDMLDRGLSYRADFNLDAALEAFTELVVYCPAYAEGYNQRAFVQFIRGNYAEALVDLEAALERSPDHLAALAGKGLTLVGLGRTEEGRDVLREAVGINPWLPERHMLRELEGQLELDGKEL
jgi:tetratricopeptide (TPR) repeat protein